MTLGGILWNCQVVVEICVNNRNIVVSQEFTLDKVCSLVHDAIFCQCLYDETKFLPHNNEKCISGHHLQVYIPFGILPCPWSSPSRSTSQIAHSSSWTCSSLHDCCTSSTFLELLSLAHLQVPAKTQRRPLSNGFSVHSSITCMLFFRLLFRTSITASWFVRTFRILIICVLLANSPI